MAEGKKEKLLQLGANVFNKDLEVEEVIVELEKLYASIGVSTNLNEYNIDDKVIQNVIPALEAHGMSAIGEHGNITLDLSEKILKMTMK